MPVCSAVSKTHVCSSSHPLFHLSFSLSSISRSLSSPNHPETKRQLIVHPAAAPPAPTTAPPPPPPKECPTFKKISHFGPDDIVFSRAKTHQVPGIFNTVKGALEVCEIVGAIIGEGVGGIPCGIGAIGVDQFVSHASECDDKNQCLMLKDRFIPECIGGADCC